MSKIIFSPLEGMSDLVNKYVTKPERGNVLVPKWFKEIPRYQNGDTKMVSSGTYHNLTVRHCMPFLDSMMAGYFLTTWTDIYVERKNGKVNFLYSDVDAVEKFGRGIINYQEYFQSHIPTQSGYDPFLYAWTTYWRIKTPEGVSCIFTQPLNRTDLPFLTLSGIMDTDKWHGSDVLNFALVEGFEGLIPKGTPYVQIIPFVRSDWEHEVLDSEDLDITLERQKVVSMRQKEVKSGYYRDNAWTNKKFI